MDASSLPPAAGCSLAQQMVDLPPDQAPAFLQAHAGEAGSSLAWELKAIFDRRESSDPAGAIAVAQWLNRLAEHSADPEHLAVAAWTQGMADQLQGDLPSSLDHLRLAEERFLELGQPLPAAATLISRLISLAMLGHYDDALRSGLRARSVFLRHHDLLAAGKIEQNLGNLYFRRDEYRKAEQFYRTARRRFLALDDAKQLAQIDNCLGSALTWQHKFDDALACYDQALARAETQGLLVTQAEIESNLGGLMLFQGRYDRALDYLERARRCYADLGLEHDAAISEKEQAEAYLELNLIPEALALLQRLLPAFEELGLQSELAASFTAFARACLGSGRDNDASAALATARSLYRQEQNALGEAHTLLVEAQQLIESGAWTEALAAAQQCETVFAQGQASEWRMRARTLRGEALHLLGEHGAAETVYAETLIDAAAHGLPQIELRCLAALGTLALAQGQAENAERLLRAGLAKFEQLRALLPSEELRISFRSDKTQLFEGLVALALAAGRTVDALHLIERARSHTLLELVQGSIPAALQPRDAFEAGLLERLAERRSGLNWLYHQLHRLPVAAEERSDVAASQLRQAASRREQEIAEIVRQLQLRSDPEQAGAALQQPLPLASLQQQLAGHTAVVEYFIVQNRLLAFVITGDAIHSVEIVPSQSEVDECVRRLRFQIDTLRSGSTQLQRHMRQLVERCRSYLRQLYTALIEPVQQYVAGRRLVIVPCGSLHYLPFHALYSEQGYLIEQAEVCVVPSAGVLHHCLGRERSTQRHDALLVGAADERTPHVTHEIEALAALFAQTTVLNGAEATLAAVQTHAPAAGVVHLACHGQFRPDNPMFSALRLADGWLTVRDAYELRLRCTLATLSACETGINSVSPGDELVGLVRGFLAAGAPSLLVSLWPVDDETTARFMRDFYTAWLAGSGLAQAHRSAQRSLLAHSPHPFYWSPFVLYGRWD